MLAALKTGDAETIHRATMIMQERVSRSSQAYLAKAKAYAADGQMDLCFEHLFLVQDAGHEKETWEIVHGLVIDLVQRCKVQNKKPRVFDREPQFLSTLKNFNEIKCAPRVILESRSADVSVGNQCVSADEIEVRSMTGNCTLLARRKLQFLSQTEFRGSLSRSFAYCGESAEMMATTYSILVCDGEVRLPTHGFVQSLIIARGNVTIGGGTMESQVISKKKVDFLNGKPDPESIIHENKQEPLGFVRFFEVADLGLDVLEKGKELHVKEVDAKKRFAGAGIRADDKIIRADGQALAGYEAFRRLVRRKYVLEEPLDLEIVRGKDAPIKAQVKWK